MFETKGQVAQRQAAVEVIRGLAPGQAIDVPTMLFEIEQRTGQPVRESHLSKIVHSACDTLRTAQEPRVDWLTDIRVWRRQTGTDQVEEIRWRQRRAVKGAQRLQGTAVSAQADPELTPEQRAYAQAAEITSAGMRQLAASKASRPPLPGLDAGAR